jgi:DnaK suppressor protein
MHHLSTEQLGHLEQLLNAQERAAKSEIRADADRLENEPFAELTGEVGDLCDRASADVIVDTNNAMMGLQLRELRDITAARERIADKRYGICIDCAAEIEYARLQAYPTAKRCTPCQQVRERTYANPGHARL